MPIGLLGDFNVERAMQPELIELEEMLLRMGPLARRAPTEWERRFARSILRNAKRPAWRPSEKQQRVMRRMIAALFEGNEAPVLFEVEEVGAPA
ncbi:hypothetical protein CNY89_05175 [Amaricoccus sp. HAR-UPW-R2A-40]|nr:hypothetical protein CNY89_05175 [Amaricoccus sp. HAR-UPW-R2A-40]